MATSVRFTSVSAGCGAARPAFFAVSRPATTARQTKCNAWTELIAAAGDVDAPVAVPIVAALVVTAVVTAAVPAYLNRGQQAADQIMFNPKQKAALDKKKKTTASKTTKKR